MQLRHAGDDSGRLFVIEQAGRIRIVRKGPTSDGGSAWSVDETPFLDISERVSCCGERGLLDVAFSPDYSVKQHFYVSYTNGEGHTVISRYKTTADPDKADPTSEETVLMIEQPHNTHNGGRLFFGPKTATSISAAATAVHPPSTTPTIAGRTPPYCWAQFYASMSSRA